MGTNYYCYDKKHRELHIGKGSSEAFSFRVYSDNFDFPLIPDIGMANKDAWFDFLLKNEVEILDEYRDFISSSDFIEMINDYYPIIKYADYEFC